MVYEYLRVSTQTQAERNSVQMQEDVISKYCAENGIEISESFRDEGISGTILERPGIMSLLTNLQEGDKIIIQNTSRLWRDDTTKVMLRKEIMKAKADVISVEQPTYSIYSTDPNDFLVNSLFELLDQWEKMQISMKLYKGRKAKSHKGSKPCGTAPFGYRWENDEIVIDYNNNYIVKDLFEKYLEIGSTARLEQYCAEKGYKTTRGNDFKSKSLYNLLHNRFYIGYVEYADVVVKGKHEPIITEELFNKVQDKFNSR